MIFKYLQENDIKNNLEYIRQNMSGDLLYMLKSASFGWTSADDNVYDSNSDIITNFLRLNDTINIGYANRGGTTSEKITWNFVCNNLGIDDQESIHYDQNTYDEFVVISFKDIEKYKSIDFKNLFVAFSNQTGDNNVTLTDGRFPETTDVLASLTNKRSSAIYKIEENNVIRQLNNSDVYDLYKSTATEKLVELNDDPEEIKIDDVDESLFTKCGFVIPSQGTIIIFPSLLATDIYNKIVGSTDKRTDLYESLMGFGTYFIESVSNLNLYLRLLNNEFNKSNNSSAYNLFNERFEYNDNVDSVYVTNILLCNDSNEILGFIKFDEPLEKNEAEEYLLTGVLKTNKYGNT